MSLSRAASLRPRERNVVWAAAIIAIGLLVGYSNTWRAPFVFDDGPAIAHAARVAQDDGLGALIGSRGDAGETTSGRPVLTLTLALNHALSGEEPWSYHALNVLIHAAAALLVFGIVRRIVAPHAERSSLPFMIAALWALHPLLTQAVTYTVQRAESLAGFFVLLTIYAFLRGAGASREHARVTTEHASCPGWLTLSVLAAGLGMATKEVAAGAPLLVLLLDRAQVAGSFRHAWRRRRWYYVGLASIWVVLAALVWSTQGRGGTAGFDTEITAWNYLLTQCGAIVRYVWLALWPQPLVFDYGTDVVTKMSAVILPGALLLTAAGATAWALRRNSMWGAAGAFFFITLAPSSSILPIASQTSAEHRMYLALLVPIATAVIGLDRALGRRAALPVVMLLVAAAWLTHQRNETYRSELALWTDTAAKRPQNARAQHNLGLAELRRGQVNRAAQHFETALRLKPGAADSHYNLGLCLAQLGRAAEAVSHYERALAVRPDHAEAHNNLATLQLSLERANDARGHLERALTLRPDFAEAHANLADAMLRLGDATASQRHASEALRLKPDFADAHVHAGNAAAELKRSDDARAHYEAALRLAPEHNGARTNLGNVLIQTGRLAEAVPHFETVVQKHPDHLQARRNLALLLMHLQRPAEAVPHLEALARALPRDEQVRDALNEARAAQRSR